MNRTTLDEQVSPLTDRYEISDLVDRLGAALDDSDFDGMQTLLAEDVAVHTPGGSVRGRDAAIAQAARNHPVDEQIQHIITNLLIDFDDSGDQARVRANLLVHFAPTPAAEPIEPIDPGATGPAPKVTCTLGEIYRFGVARTVDGWRFTSVDSVPIWMSGVAPQRPRPAGG